MARVINGKNISNRFISLYNFPIFMISPFYFHLELMLITSQQAAIGHSGIFHLWTFYVTKSDSMNHKDNAMS